VRIGDPEVVAVESGITRAFANPGLRALGYFVIHVANKQYGVRSREATLLANSFDTVGKRIADRGRHMAPFATIPDASSIATCMLKALYAENVERDDFLGLRPSEFANVVYQNHLIWAPDGDAAFDDRSFVLQFDIGDCARVIGFRRHEDSGVESLGEVSLPAEQFYDILQQWHKAFEAEWQKMPKDNGSPL
jgi:hypothetical protein